MVVMTLSSEIIANNCFLIIGLVTLPDFAVVNNLNKDLHTCKPLTDFAIVAFVLFYAYPKSSVSTSNPSVDLEKHWLPKGSKSQYGGRDNRITIVL
jgi:hypothetical protein